MEQERDEQGKWLPGTSGNPHGRPPSGQAQSDLLRKRSDDIDPDTGLPNREIITNKIIELAKEGVPWAIKEWYDRTEGKARQSMDITGNIQWPDVVGFVPGDYASSDRDTSTSENTDAD
jgi:hypothetical protein